LQHQQQTFIGITKAPMSRFNPFTLSTTQLNMTDHAPTAVQADPRGARNSSNLVLHAKTYPKIYGYVLALAPAIILFGYDAVAVSSIVSLTSFQYLHMNLFFFSST
jgi:hypothetical protein